MKILSGNREEDNPIIPIEEIKRRLKENAFPFRGRTKLGSATFAFNCPSPLAATAIHSSGRIRDELHPLLKIGPEDRRREEDPGTEFFLRNFPITITANDSRYEYDINRESERAIYDIAWGNKVFNSPLDGREKEISLAKHTEFHHLMEIVAEYLIRDNDYGVILDLHSFNYRRKPYLPDNKPDINIGTRAVNRARFGDLIDAFISDLNNISINRRGVRTAENEIFTGGYLSRSLSFAYHDNLLVLAIEFKKIYMDEWTGEIYHPVLEKLVDKFTRAVEDNFIK